MPTAGAILVWSAVALALYPFMLGHMWSLLLAVLAIGMGGCLGTVLQIRLMDIAHESQGLAAALNHSAFNFANALGPRVAGLALEAGWGWASIGWVDAGLTLGGLAIWRTATLAAGALATPRREFRPSRPHLS